MSADRYNNAMNPSPGVINSYYNPNAYYPQQQYNQQQYTPQYHQSMPSQYPNPYPEYMDEYNSPQLRKEVRRHTISYPYENQGQNMSYKDMIKEEDPREMHGSRRESFTMVPIPVATDLKDNISTQAARSRSIFYEFLKKTGMVSPNIESFFSDIKKNLNFKVPKVLSPTSLMNSYEKLLQKSLANPRQAKKNWNEEEFLFLTSIITYYSLIQDLDCGALGNESWAYLASLYPGKRPEQLKKKWQNAYKVHLSKVPWSKTEDEILIQVIKEKGTERHWREIALALNARTGSKVYRHAKQCRERWINHLDPTKNRGTWADFEDTNLLNLYLELGRKWSEIAKRMSDRTENSVKNRWNSLLKKYKNEVEIEPFPKGASLENATAWERKIARLILEAKKNGLCTAPQYPEQQNKKTDEFGNTTYEYQEHHSGDESENEHDQDNQHYSGDSENDLGQECSGLSKKSDSTWESKKDTVFPLMAKPVRKHSIMSEEPPQNSLFGNFSLNDLSTSGDLTKTPSLNLLQQSAPQSLENIIDSCGTIGGDPALAQDMLGEKALVNRMRVQESMSQMINPSGGSLNFDNRPDQSITLMNPPLSKKDSKNMDITYPSYSPGNQNFEYKTNNSFFPPARSSQSSQNRQPLFGDPSRAGEIELGSLLKHLKAQNREHSDHFSSKALQFKMGFDTKKEDINEQSISLFPDLFNNNPSRTSNMMAPNINDIINKNMHQQQDNTKNNSEQSNYGTGKLNQQSMMNNWP